MFDAAKVRERKRSKRREKVSRRASKVTVSFLPPTRRVRRPKQSMSEQPTRASESPRADFADMRPENVHPWDWNQMYVDERELWPAIIEEAQHAVAQGELQPYVRRQHA